MGYYELEGITLENWYEKFYEDLENGKDIDDIIANIKMKKSIQKIFDYRPAYQNCWF